MVAGLMLLMQLVDLFWLLGPDLLTQGHGHAPLQLHWMDLAARPGAGGAVARSCSRGRLGPVRSCPWASPPSSPGRRVPAGPRRSQRHERSARESRGPVREGGRQREVLLLVRGRHPRGDGGARPSPPSRSTTCWLGAGDRGPGPRRPTWRSRTPPPSSPRRPRLQVRPEIDLAAFRAQEAAILTTYAWVDKEHGIVRIPVEDAMRLVAERGLPVVSAPRPARARAGGATP